MHFFVTLHLKIFPILRDESIFLKYDTYTSKISSGVRGMFIY